MNIKYRESLNEQIRKFIAIGEWDEKPRFTDIKRTITVGASMFYTAIAKTDGRYGVKAGDLVYFKKNPTRGINPNNARTDEARGSCEDVGEVLTHFTVKAMNEKLGKKLVRARQEWVPYVIVVGDNEVNGAKFKVNDRLNNQVLEMSKEELEIFIKEQIKDYPYRPIALSKYISKRPIFYGSLS